MRFMLEYEWQQVRYLVIEPSDGAHEPQLASDILTLLVSDVQVELSVYLQEEY